MARVSDAKALLVLSTHDTACLGRLIAPLLEEHERLSEQGWWLVRMVSLVLADRGRFVRRQVELNGG